MRHKEDFRQGTDVLVLLKYIENYFLFVIFLLDFTMCNSTQIANLLILFLKT